ncbi:MAG: aminopeptidase [Aureispira sp.]|nr:aminopeptidase [Aureispira sp.]
MKNLLLIGAFLLAYIGATAQYDFKVSKEIKYTPIKSQDRTGTCWSFATSSFLESELKRMGKGDYDLSEMYTVRNIYLNKAQNYLFRQGKANFSQGSLSHDVINAFKMGGAMPESAYSGIASGDKKHDHSELAKVLNGMMTSLTKVKRPSTKWRQVVNAVLDVYLGTPEQKFKYKGKEYTPQTFAASLGINTKDYISVTSYTHHPFYENFVLEIPDNYSNGSYQNVPIDELMKITDHALKNGFSIAWDGDVSEKGFSGKQGIAVLPTDVSREDLFENPSEELFVDQELRQSTFENYSTTDDHLMHVVGTAKDKKGTKYYIIKNSWGAIGPYKGLIYMSEAYFKLKTVAILLHKDGIPKDIKSKF